MVGRFRNGKVWVLPYRATEQQMADDRSNGPAFTCSLLLNRSLSMKAWLSRLCSENDELMQRYDE